MEWEPLNEGLWGGPVKQIVAYSETTRFAIAGNGRLYRSRDRGYSWELLNAGGNTLHIAHLLVLPDGDLLASTGQQALLRSSNEGDTWTVRGIEPRLDKLVRHPSGHLIGAGYVPGVSRGKVFQSSDQGRTWLSIMPDSVIFVHDLDITPLGTLLLTTDAGAFRSTDRGDSWSDMGLGSDSFRSFTVAADSSLFISVRDDDDPFCVYRSQDDGLTWKGILCPGERKYIDGMGSKDGKLISVVQSEIFISSDDGVSWQSLMDFGEFDFNAFDDGLLWLDDQIFITSPSLGLVVSEDSGQTWQVADEGITAISINNLAQHPDGTLYASASRYGLIRSRDRGASWERVELDVYGISDLLITEEGDLFVTGRGAYRSTDNGRTWVQLDEACIGEGLATAPDGTLYFIEFNQIFYSTDKGDFCEALPGQLVGFRTLAFASNGDMLAGVNAIRRSTDGIYRSGDGGITWQIMDIPFATGVDNLIITPEGTVLGDIYGHGVLRSEDDGYSFELIDPDLHRFDNFQEFTIAPDGITYGASQTGGIFRTNDDGKTWEHVSAGLPTQSTYALLFDEDGFLYVGTSQAGIYRSIQAVGTASESEREWPASVYLKASFPNPFRQATTIPFSLDRTAPVRVSIYNTLGQEVDVVVQKTLGPGEHQVQWVPEQQRASGLYFCHLQIGDQVAVRPLTLIR